MTETQPLKYEEFTILNRGYIEVYPSEYRDKNVKGKFYAYAKFITNRGDYWTSDDFDTPEEAIKSIKEDIINELTNDNWKEVIVFNNINNILKQNK